MENAFIETAYQYMNDIDLARRFMTKKFGEVHFLREKNAGNISVSESNIRDSQIMAYDFHGKGCGFKKKNYLFEIEFDLKSGAFGFTKWTLYLYVKSKLGKKLSDHEVEDLIKNLQSKYGLIEVDNVYFRIATSLS